MGHPQTRMPIGGVPPPIRWTLVVLGFFWLEEAQRIKRALAGLSVSYAVCSQRCEWCILIASSSALSPMSSYTGV